MTLTDEQILEVVDDVFGHGHYEVSNPDWIRFARALLASSSTASVSAEAKPVARYSMPSSLNSRPSVRLLPDAPKLKDGDLLYAQPAQSIADTAGAKPVNGIPATLQHDEGAIARCSYCGRYSLDPKTLSNRQPKCECGEQHGWSGSFQKPVRDAKWSGTTPPAPSVADAAGASDD